MEPRDQRQESQGVHVCNKCGWPFPNPHPSARHRRAHRRVCGTIEGFKLVESEANNLLTISDDDGDQKSSSPKVLGGSCSDKGVDGMKTKPKESGYDVFSDAVAEFSDGVGPKKSVGDALGSVSTLKMMLPEDEMNRSQTFRDALPLSTSSTWKGIVENAAVADTTITNNQGFVNFKADSRSQLSSSSTENKKVEKLIVAETAIDRSENEQETRVDQELMNLEADFGAPSSSSSTEIPEATLNQSGTEQETIINQELVKLETNLRTEDSVVPPNEHMNTTTAGDLYVIEPKPRIHVPQQERNNDSVENVPQCSLPYPDTRYDEKKNEVFSFCKNAEITALSENSDNNESKLALKSLAETVPTEPTALNITPQSMADDGMPVDLTQAMSDAQKELESCSCNNLILETDKINEGNENLHPPSISSDLNAIDHPEVLVEESKDHKEVRLTNCVVHDPHEGVSGLEDYFKDPIPKESYSTLKAKPFDQAAEVASFDMKTVEERQIQDNGVNSVLVDVQAVCFRNSGQEIDENSSQEVNARQIEGENGKHDKSQTISIAANLGTDSIPSDSFSPEVEQMAPYEKSLDNISVNVMEALSNENAAVPTCNQKKLDDNEVGIIGGVLLADEENKAGELGRHSEDTVQVHLPVDARESKDNANGDCEMHKLDNLDVAGAEDKKGRLDEKFSTGIASTMPESITNSRENKCSAPVEEISNESPSKFSGPKSVDPKSFDITLVKEDDHCGAVHLACISEAYAGEANAGDKSDINAVQNSTDVHVNKEANLVPVCNVSVTGRSDASQDGSVSQPFGDAVRITSKAWQDDSVKTDLKPQLTSSLLDASVDATSRTDSLEGNWGSVSVLSTQSELIAAIGGEVTLQAQTESEGTESKKTNAATERQHSDRSELFEPSSFMTLVESNGGTQNSATSNIETAQNRQQTSNPSNTHVANDSPRRKKNGEIIAKVTNWSTGKPHTALKNLLDDAALENKQRSSPTQKGNLASMIQNDENVTKIDKHNTRTKSPTSELRNKEIPNEWNSPARYPSDFGKERRKGKSYWAQFVCCSSVLHQ